MSVGVAAFLGRVKHKLPNFKPANISQKTCKEAAATEHLVNILSCEEFRKQGVRPFSPAWAWCRLIGPLLIPHIAWFAMIELPGKLWHWHFVNFYRAPLAYLVICSVAMVILIRSPKVNSNWTQFIRNADIQVRTLYIV